MIRDLRRPTNITELRSLLGMGSVFRRFEPNFARTDAPLSRKLRKHQRNYFGNPAEDELRALQTLKQKLITPHVLALGRFTGTYTLHTNACGRKVGCIPFQQQPGRPGKPIHYFWKSFYDAERDYDTTHKEFIAGVWNVLLPKLYLEGTRFIIQLDHDALH